jgi:predicted ferric reductase
MLLIFSFLRRLSYKAFVRFHQILAFVAAYALWRHLFVKKLFAHIYILIAIGLFAAMMAWQVLLVLFRNLVLGHAFARADVTQLNGMIEISLTLPRPWTIRAGQYINLCIPSISVLSFIQSHSFMIASWTEGNAPGLFLLASAKAGFTRKLLQYARPHSDDPSDSDYRLAWFSGPHGLTMNLGDYGSVTMVATGLGIAAQLPYLKELIKGYNNCKVRTRRIQLIWQIATWGEYSLTHIPSEAEDTNSAAKRIMQELLI